MTTQLISRDFHGATIRQRSSDGYLCATDMCQSVGKRLNNYLRTKTTTEFLTELSDFVAKNPVALFGVTEQNQQLIQIVQGGTPEKQGTWIHPYVAMNLAQWCSPMFAVMVSNWTFELLTKGSVSLDPKLEIAPFAQAKANELDKLGIIGNAKQIALNNAIKQQFDCDMLQLFGIESQVAEIIQQALLIPTEIAKRVGLKSARPVNVKLTELGLQTNHRDDKKRLYYELTNEGFKHAQYQDTGRKHNSGCSVRTIKWYESVLQFFQALPIPKVFKLT
jgi:hypothetical protein